ncbi:hypothetical protein BH10ACI4_BH10ACI4_36070 [soil metagenome]
MSAEYYGSGFQPFAVGISGPGPSAQAGMRSGPRPSTTSDFAQSGNLIYTPFDIGIKQEICNCKDVIHTFGQVPRYDPVRSHRRIQGFFASLKMTTLLQVVRR